MTTVVSRTFRSNPYRDAIQTWTSIVELLTQGKASTARNELLSVAGIAASLITDRAPKDAAIVVVCDGPRTRIYCTYDEDAIDGSNENENPLGFDPLNGDWSVSLPCNVEDLLWIQGALKKISSRITARDKESPVSTGEASQNSSNTLTLNPQGFLNS